MSSTGDAGPSVSPGRLGLVLVVLVAAQFIVVLDFSVVRIALGGAPGFTAITISALSAARRGE